MNRSSFNRDEELDVLGHKKRKKHKHKKHKKRMKANALLKCSNAAAFLSLQDSDPELSLDGDMKQPNAVKLKFKIGGQTLGETSVAIIHGDNDEENQLIEVVDDVPPAPASDISDEDAWLEALESGKLDEYDEMRRMKDPALMTARQKALLESKSQRPCHLPEYLMLPTGYKEKVMTEEMIQKREMKAKKRRQQAQEKREKDKIQTIDRLLKKQESKPKGSKSKLHKKAVEVPKFSYVRNRDMSTISVPVGYSFPMEPTSLKSLQPPTPIHCGVPHCPNLKRYSCSRTGVPLCSLECYKKNMALHSVT